MKKSIDILEQPTETPTKLPILTPKKKAYHVMRESGASNTEASQVLDITPGRGNQIKQELSKYFIQDKKFLGKGKRAVKKILDDFLADVGNIKPADVLKVVDMQQDRINPVVKQAGPATIIFNVVNLDRVG